MVEDTSSVKIVGSIRWRIDTHVQDGGTVLVIGKTGNVLDCSIGEVVGRPTVSTCDGTVIRSSRGTVGVDEFGRWGVNATHRQGDVTFIDR